jgi:CRP/FNR family transcriptional regulator, cyclic AMP receptor protein
MNTEIKFHYLKSHSIANNLNQEQLIDLCSLAKFRHADKGENIYFDEDADKRVYLLIKGVIKVSEISDNGNELIKEIIRQGDFFGDVSLNNAIKQIEYATAIVDDTVICSFNRHEFEAILNRHGILALNFAKKMGGKLQRLESRHADLVFLDVKTRLVNFIKEWAAMEGKKTTDRIVLKNYFTHSDIAGMISTSRQSVTILLNELKQTGLINYNRKEIEIADISFLN